MDRLGLNLDDTRPGRFSPGGSSARIFISYSRKDGGSFSADLREKLLGQQISVWQDIVSLEGGRDWWSQIEEALEVEGAGAFRAPGYAGGARDRRIAIRRRVGKILT